MAFVGCRGLRFPEPSHSSRSPSDCSPSSARRAPEPPNLQVVLYIHLLTGVKGLRLSVPCSTSSAVLSKSHWRESGRGCSVILESLPKGWLRQKRHSSPSASP